MLKRHPSLATASTGPVESAVREALVSRASAQSLEGLTIMRDLAIRGPDRLTEREAGDFVTLARAASYAIRTDKLDS